MNIFTKRIAARAFQAGTDELITERDQLRAALEDLKDERACDKGVINALRAELQQTQARLVAANINNTTPEQAQGWTLAHQHSKTVAAMKAENDELRAENQRILNEHDDDYGKYQNEIKRIENMLEDDDRFVTCCECKRYFLAYQAEDWGYEGAPGAWYEDETCMCPECFGKQMGKDEGEI